MDDVYVHIGGGVDHIGAVALVGVRPDGELYGEVLCIPPHKEADVALRSARTIHEAFGVNVCVSAGFHVDDISPEEIREALRNIDQAVVEFVGRANSEESGKLVN